MKKFLFVAVVCLLVASNAGAQGTLSLSSKDTDCKTFIHNKFGIMRIPPFSFKYGGKPSSVLLRKWKFYREDPASSCPSEHIERYNWIDPETELKVSCEVKYFDDFNVMQWTLFFANTTGKNTMQITDVKVVDLDLTSTSHSPWQLFSADGSTAAKSDFHPRMSVIEDAKPVQLHPEGGRSSDGVLPFFNLKSADGGVVFAVGWSGDWKADIQKSKNGVSVSTGMMNFDSYLEPKEQIRMPSTAMLVWKGNDRMVGQNLFRQFILTHNYPQLEGKPATYPLCSGFNWGDPAPCNEYSCLTSLYARALIERSELFGIVPDCFWLDAGWYVGSADWESGKNWANTVGNWQVDKARFPLGLGEISDAAHSAGSKLMVWFEPERVMNNSQWARMHPDYMLTKTGQKPVPVGISDEASETWLLDLGNPEALKWLCGSMEYLLKENRIDYYRQDFNMEPRDYWRNNDKSFRKGITEIRYITGLYQYWDFLRKRFPGMLIDNCASGGRRIDLETTARSAPLWRTDYSYGEPLGAQCHTYGLSQWIPVSGTGTCKGDAYSVRSAFSATLALNWNTTKSEISFLDMRRRVAEYKNIQPYFMADFYPLSDSEDITADDIWLAYQLHRQSDNSGYIVAFRRDLSTKPSLTIKLHAIVPDYIYVFEDQNTGDRIEMKGAEVADQMVINLEDVHSSLVVKYWRK